MSTPTNTTPSQIDSAPTTQLADVADTSPQDDANEALEFLTGLTLAVVPESKTRLVVAPTAKEEALIARLNELSRTVSTTRFFTMSFAQLSTYFGKPVEQSGVAYIVGRVNDLIANEGRSRAKDAKPGSFYTVARYVAIDATVERQGHLTGEKLVLAAPNAGTLSITRAKVKAAK